MIPGLSCLTCMTETIKYLPHTVIGQIKKKKNTAKASGGEGFHKKKEERKGKGRKAGRKKERKQGRKPKPSMWNREIARMLGAEPRTE